MSSKVQLTIACFAAFTMILLCSGCTGQPVEAAPQGGLPGVKIPVGPIPGPPTMVNYPTNPYLGNPVAIVEGRRLFLWYNCAGCHGGRGGGGMAPSLRDPVWRFGDTPAQIFSSIAEGRGQGMPAWGTRIPNDQIWKLVAYIKSMRTPAEPNPPALPPHPWVKEAAK